MIFWVSIFVSRVSEHLDHRVYGKPAHIDQYLHKLSNHHTSRKQGSSKDNPTKWAKRICATHHLSKEQEHLDQRIQENKINNETSY